MSTAKPTAVILHVRLPDTLRGRDHQRYIERKLSDFGVRLRPPLTLGGTGIPVGYGLVRPDMGGWHVVEARGEVADGVSLIHLQQHELVEDAMDEAAETERRARREAERPEKFFPDDGDENITAGGPMPNPLLMAVLRVGVFALTPITLAARGIHRIRCWYIREIG